MAPKSQRLSSRPEDQQICIFSHGETELPKLIVWNPVTTIGTVKAFSVGHKL
jgi:hypothetical protein